MGKETVTNRETTLKKQRKKSNSTSEVNKPDEDVYKKLVEFEEKEAMKRSPEQDAELYFETCNDIRKLLEEIIELKKLATPEAKAQISEKRIEACMHVALLKKLNRLEKFRTKSGRDELHQEKLHTDSTKLQLQNLLYELTYLKKEISKCFQFRSMDEEIDLISEEQFYKDAPESISKPELTKNDPHHLQLSRLEWELEQRKQLSNECKKLETEKSNVAKQIVEKQELLNKLGPQLHNILEVMKPLQEQLGMVDDKIRAEHQLAYLLPDPLYLLYAKIDAYTRVYDKTTKVNILGEEEDARMFKKDEPESQDSTAESDSDPEQSEEVEYQKRHHRKSSNIETEEDKRNKLLTSHPLSIRIEIHSAKISNSILHIDFYYKLNLHIITIKSKVITPEPITGIYTEELLSSNNLLRELFPNDTGEESPNAMNHYQLEKLKLQSFSSLVDELGYAYIWAQKICGLNFIDSKSRPAPNSELSQSTIETVMKLLNQRFYSRISLAIQMQDLEKNIIPIIPDKFSIPMKISDSYSIKQWRRITWEEFCEQYPRTELLTDQQLINDKDYVYRFHVNRDEAKLTAFVAIKNNFPSERAVFNILIERNGKLHSGNSESIWDMERAVNSDWPTDLKPDVNIWLLSAQIWRVVSCFDLYLEITSPDDFPQEKIYFSSNSGRGREQPYKYLKSGGGVFMHY